MPAHRHGMNYRARVSVRDDGAYSAYSAEGLMFHMPGRWRLIFDLEVAGQDSRLTHDLELP